MSSYKITLSDVASAAGVSLATASKALLDRPRVSERTKAKVKQAAADLNYRPNSVAQSLAVGKSNTVGVITSDLQGRLSTPILIGAENELGTRSHSVLLCNSRGESMLERHQISTLVSKRIDGLIVMNRDTNVREPIEERLPFPVVYAYAPSSNPEDSSVTADNVDGGRIAAEHLADLGRKHIAIIGGDPTYAAATDRVAGALSALESRGLKPVHAPMFGAWTEDWGAAAAKIILDANDGIDAIICGSDQIARGCMEYLQSNGRQIPEDIAVIGHDNWDIFVESTHPRLSSVDNQLEKIGAAAASAIIDAINGNTHHGTTLIPCRLFARESTLRIQ